MDVRDMENVILHGFDILPGAKFSSRGKYTFSMDFLCPSKTRAKRKNPM